METVSSGTHFEHGFDKMMTLLGIEIYKHSAVPDWALHYAATVIGDYLDSDMDGVPDDAKIANVLSDPVTLIGQKLTIAVAETNDVFTTSEFKDSFLAITRTYGQECLECPGGYKRNAIEELNHAVFMMLWQLYPNVFGTDENSEVMRAVQQAYGTCEYASTCAPSCTNYVCSSDDDCQFATGSCDGVFHYDAPSCEPEGCLTMEGLYWAWTALYDLQEDHCQPGEWEVCTSDGMKTNPKVEMFYKLVSGQSASQAVEGYVVPSAVPDGAYCGSSHPPSPSPAPSPSPSPSERLTCGEVKELYKRNQCCGMPDKIMQEGRRLSASIDADNADDTEIINSIQMALQAAKKQGGATEVAKIASKLDGILRSYS